MLLKSLTPALKFFGGGGGAGGALLLPLLAPMAFGGGGGAGGIWVLFALPAAFLSFEAVEPFAGLLGGKAFMDGVLPAACFPACSKATRSFLVCLDFRGGDT